MTPEFEDRLKKAIDDRVLPATVLVARTKSRKIDYTFAHGPTTLKPGAPPITPTTMMTMASLTKLITAICLLKLVEGNILKIDEDVTMYLETLAKQPILTGFDAEGQPTYKQRETPVTLRHLLTHSAGTGYILMEEKLAKWVQATGRQLPVPLRHSPLSGGMSVDSRFGYPLLFEPGQGWVYGSSMDWAGRLIEKLTGAFFDDFVYENVLSRVGIPKGAITFHPGRFREPTYDLMAGMAERNAETGKLEHKETEYDEDNEGFGGEGLYGGMGPYMEVMYSILMDDGKILKPQTAKWLFEPLQQPTEKKAMNEWLQDPDWAAVGYIPRGVEYDWSAGGLLSISGEGLGHRKKFFLQWGGAWNLYWFIDREAGVCAAVGTQVFPPGDPQVQAFMKEFEDVVYSKL
ncbi:beta-lactamase/transpeptidase-like protein [Chaetomium sp. MPI-CAGE-AT-0009]|nr:beta-lactamase/transpeptidase-like protein [Chaetomium sp. MPI-CAGE-AT-0009]